MKTATLSLSIRVAVLINAGITFCIFRQLNIDGKYGIIEVQIESYERSKKWIKT
jgi:hypothetical protein